MNSNIVKLLLGTCLILLLILLIEWLLMDSFEEALAKAQSASQELQTQDMELPQLLLAEQPIDAYSDMVNSPLFIKGRKPVIENEATEVTQEVSKIDDLTLVGIYTVKDQIYTLFSQQGRDRKHLKKLQGDDVSGWLLKEIQVDNVILERAGIEQTLLLRKPKPKTAARLKSNTRNKRRKAKSGQPERRKPKSDKPDRRKPKKEEQRDKDEDKDEDE